MNINLIKISRVQKKNVKKLSLMYFLVFSMVFLFFSEDLKAAECTLSSSDSCVSASGTGGIVTGIDDTLDTTPDKKILKVSGAKLDNPVRNLIVKANKSILNVGNLSVENGSTVDINFQDSVWNTQDGKLILTRGGFINPSNIKFNGSYQGNSDANLKGYAFVGDMLLKVGIVKVGFQNGANMKGTLLTEGNSVPTSSSFDVVFSNSSLEGAINTQYSLYPDYPTLNVTFNGNGSKGFAFDGSSTMNSSNLNITFNNGAIWTNASMSVEFGTLNVNANSGSKIFLKSFGGPRDSSGNNPTRNINLDNSILQGSIEGSKANITNKQGTLNFNAKNNSRVYADFISQFSYTAINIPRNSTLKFEQSSLIGNITNRWLRGSPTSDGLNTNVSFTGNNSTDGFAYSGTIENQQSIMNVSFSNGALWKDGNFIGGDTSSLIFGTGSKMNGSINANGGTTTLKVSGNSTISDVVGAGKLIATIGNSNTGNINNTNKDSTLNFNFTTPSSDVGVAGMDNFSPIYTLGNIAFSGSLSGTIDYAKIGNISLNTNKTSNLVINNSTINYLLADNGAQATLNITNSVIGAGINSNWGILKTTLSESVVRGNITWSDGIFADKDGSTSNGLTFSNNSKLIGNISAPAGGNFSTSNNFTFKSSSMEGNILINNKTKAEINNTVGISFSEKSSFNGSIMAQGTSVINLSFSDSALDIKSIFASSDSSSVTFSNIKDAQIGDIDFAGTISGDLSGSNIGNINANNGKLDLKLDTSSVGSITNTNSTSRIVFAYTPPPLIAGEGSVPSPEFNRTSIGNINFSGVLSGQISYANIGDITNANTASDIILQNTLSSTFVPSAEKPFDYFIGNINYSGKITTQLENTQLGNISLNGSGNDIKISKNSLAGFISISGGNSKFDISNTHLVGGINTNLDGKLEMKLDHSAVLKNADGSKTGSVSADNASISLALTRSLISGSISSANKANMNISFKDGSTILGGSITSEKQAISNISFSSEASGIDFTQASMNLATTTQNLIKDGTIKLPYPMSILAPKDGEVISNVDLKPEDALVSAVEGVDVGFPDSSPALPTLTVEQMKQANAKAIQTYLYAHPDLIVKYLYDSGISSYYGDIQTFSNATHNIDYNDSLYLGGLFSNKGGNANITMIFSKDFIDKLKTNDLTKALLYEGDGPSFHINTQASEENANPITNIALAGDVKGKADVYYQDGYTNIIFSDQSTGTFSGTTTESNSNTDFSNYAAGSGFILNGYSFQDGILIRLDASKANSLLAPYRNLFSGNYVQMFVDKISDPDTYKASISGVLVGEVDSLASSAREISSLTESATAVRSKAYEATLNPNAVFIGKLNIKDTHTSIKLSQGSKLILEDGSQIANLSSANKKDLSLDKGNIVGDSITQTNTIIDLATNGIPSVKLNQKVSFSKLNIDKVEDLNNAIFRVAYNPNAQASDAGDKKSDHIIIKSASSFKSSDSVLFDYIQAYQNTSAPVLTNLSDKNILVASVKNTKNVDGSFRAYLEFNTQSSVLQGYDIIHTNFEKRIENSSDGSNVMSVDASIPAEVSAGDSAASDSWTNYYIRSATASIQETPRTMTESAISTPYYIFLANINDLNKRLGELRNNTNSQGVWARVFNGLSTTNRGEEVKTYSTNIQAGYDYAIPTDSSVLGSGQSVVGFALSYGYNTLKSLNFTGKAALIEAGLYYSYVGSSGFYSDSIAKYAFIDNQLELQNNQKIDTRLDVSSFSYGQEFGYRFMFTLKEKESSKHSIYLEPQVEGVLGYMTNGGFDQINGNSYLNSAISSILAFRARAGGVLAYSFRNNQSQTDFRVGISYVNDLIQGGDIKLKSNMAEAMTNIESNNMLIASLGVNSSISDAWKVYIDLESGFLGKTFNQNYLVSLGGRYSFGKSTLGKQSFIGDKNNDNQTTKIVPGFYFEVYVLQANQKLNHKQEEFLKKYPYVVDYQTRNIKQNGRMAKATYKVYLFGGFKTTQGALNNQKVANEISSTLYNQPNIQAQLKEIK